MMHTQKRFCRLTEESAGRKFGLHEKDVLALRLNESQAARIQALSERLKLSGQQTLQELLDCALGDAHDGFLSAFSDPLQREQENKVLKQRVITLKDLKRSGR